MCPFRNGKLHNLFFSYHSKNLALTSSPDLNPHPQLFPFTMIFILTIFLITSSHSSPPPTYIYDCLLIHREHEPSDSFTAYITHNYLSMNHPSTQIFPSWTIFNSSHQTFPSLSRKPIKYGSDCAVSLIFQKDGSNIPRMEHDIGSLFQNYYHSPESVFIILRQIPDATTSYLWVKSPASVYLHFLSSTLPNSHHFPTYELSKNGAVPKYNYVPTRFGLSSIFSRHYRPTLQNAGGVPIFILEYRQPYETPCSLRSLKKPNLGDYPCEGNEEMIFILRTLLNFTRLFTDLKDIDRLDKARSGYNLIIPQASGLPETITRLPTLQYSRQRNIVYCKKVDLFLSKWTVWLSPYDLGCWIGLVLSLLGMSVFSLVPVQNILTCVTTWCLEIYFLYSIVIRQQIKAYSNKYVVFVLAMLVFSSGYESFITVQLVAPSIPLKIGDIGEYFGKGGYKYIIVDGSGHYSHYDIRKDPDISREFQHYKVSHFLNKSFDVSSKIVWVLQVAEALGTNESAGMLLDKEQENVELYTQIYESYAKNWVEGGKLICDKFPLGGHDFMFWLTHMSGEREVKKILVSARETGLKSYWDRYFLNWVRMRYHFNLYKNPRLSTVSRNLMISIKSLSTFFGLWALLMGLSIIAGFREVWQWSKSSGWSYREFKGIAVRLRKFCIESLQMCLLGWSVSCNKYFGSDVME